ncbi:Acetyl-CoA synthetase [[Clostridium] ultunense Esp]|nr:Acetyl-CoA synthetase [[Clostridium] ultunense Esp]
MHEIIKKAKQEKRNLLEHEALELLKEYNIPVPKNILARDAEEAVAAARKIKYPVVLKVVSKDILHKSDIGGVKIGLNSEKEVVNAYEEIMDNVNLKASGADIEGVLVVENAKKGLECIVGMVRDPQLGPALMFGLGGIFVELLEDVSFNLLPIHRDEALEMVKSTKGYKLIKGYRGEKAKDIESIVDLIIKVGKLVEENEEINEIDINPFFVYEEGLITIDARVIIE